MGLDRKLYLPPIVPIFIEISFPGLRENFEPGGIPSFPPPFCQAFLKEVVI